MTIHVARGLPPVGLAGLRAAFDAVRKRFPQAPSRVSLALLGDDAMAELHRQFSGVDGTTDVLSFDLRSDQGAALTPVPTGVCEAEIAVGVEVAYRTAARRRIDPQRELELYFAHGLLHLCGFDDHEPGDRRRMRAAERAVLGLREISLRGRTRGGRGTLTELRGSGRSSPSSSTRPKRRR